MKRRKKLVDHPRKERPTYKPRGAPSPRTDGWGVGPNRANLPEAAPDSGELPDPTPHFQHYQFDPTLPRKRAHGLPYGLDTLSADAHQSLFGNKKLSDKLADLLSNFRVTQLIS